MDVAAARFCTLTRRDPLHLRPLACGTPSPPRWVARNLPACFVVSRRPSAWPHIHPTRTPPPPRRGADPHPLSPVLASPAPPRPPSPPPLLLTNPVPAPQTDQTNNCMRACMCTRAQVATYILYPSLAQTSLSIFSCYIIDTSSEPGGNNQVGGRPAGAPIRRFHRMRACCDMPHIEKATAHCACGA